MNATNGIRFYTVLDMRLRYTIQGRIKTENNVKKVLQKEITSTQIQMNWLKIESGFMHVVTNISFD
jgi:hypothetical protein